MSATNDLTLVYYTCNSVPTKFAAGILKRLLESKSSLPMIVVSHNYLSALESPPWEEIIVNLPRHHLSIYRQALIGANAATTKYIALCEDDVLYSPEHFKHRPQPGKFAYNMNYWNVTTWGDPMFTQKLGGRRNLGNLICERDLFIESMEERFAKWPDDSKIDLSCWAEPSKYEKNLGVTVREAETFCTNPPNIMFSHETALSFGNLGTRKRAGEIRATEIPYWNRAEDIVKLYKGGDDEESQAQ